MLVQPVDVVATVNSKVDNDPRDHVSRHASPPTSERRTVEVSIKVRNIRVEASMVCRPLWSGGLEVDAERTKEARSRHDIGDDHVDRSESRLCHLSSLHDRRRSCRWSRPDLNPVHQLRSVPDRSAESGTRVLSGSGSSERGDNSLEAATGSADTGDFFGRHPPALSWMGHGHTLRQA
jgi:hypothetical protein